MKSNIISIGVAVLAISCSVHERDRNGLYFPSDQVFYAQLETPASDFQTKVYVDDDLKVLWHAGDLISIFNKYTYNQEYRFTGETGANSGYFEKIENEGFITGNVLDLVYAVYPYKKSTKISNQGVLSIELPVTQSYVQDSFGAGANAMVSCTDNNELMFKNLCGYLMLKLFGDDVTVTSVSLKGNNGEPLAGTATVQSSVDSNPSMVLESDAPKEISLTFDVPVKIGTTPETASVFWLVVPPTLFSKGITVTVCGNTNGVFEKSTTKSLAIERNKLTRMSALEVVMESDPDPLQIQVEYPSELSYGPSLSLEENLSSLMKVVTNKDPDEIHLLPHSTDSWIYIENNAMAVNGNPSVEARTGVLEMDVYYGSEQYTTVSIPINQSGVNAYISSPSNLTDFDLYAGADLGGHTVAFTPYGGSETVTFVSNSDGYLNPLAESALPTIVTGDNFVEDQVFPDLSFDGQAMTITYPSNRSILNRACIFNYIPLIWVVQDWTDLDHSYVPFYVSDQDGKAFYISVVALQSPVYVAAHYQNYYALPVSGADDPYPGYNLFKAYGNNADNVLSDQIVIHSNVGWQQCGQSLPEDGLSYSIPNPVVVSGDGRHIVTTTTGMMVPDRLDPIEDEYIWPFSECYRPDQDFMSLQSAYRAWVDLEDGQSPMLVDVARIIQAGVPHVVFKDYDIFNYPRGAYQYNGYTYPYRDELSCYYGLSADDVTFAFTKTINLFVSYEGGDGLFPVNYANGNHTFSVDYYAVPDSDDFPFVIRRIIWDCYSTMINDVVIRAEMPIDDHWSEDPRYAPARPEQAASVMGKIILQSPSGTQGKVLSPPNYTDYKRSNLRLIDSARLVVPSKVSTEDACRSIH